MKKEVVNTNKKSNFWEFPEKLNKLSLLVILVLIASIGVVILILVFPKSTYEYMPDYEELEFSEYFNPAIAISSSTTRNEEEKKNVTTNSTYIFYYNVLNYRMKNVVSNFIGIREDGSIEYFNMNVRDNPSNSSVGISSTADNKDQVYDTLFGKIEYDSYDKDDAEKVERRYIEMREDIIKVTTEERAMADCNDFTERSDLFDSFKVTEGTQSDTQDRVNFSIDFTKEAREKFHFDFQAYCVDSDGNIYPLVGFYNISNEYDRAYSRTGYIPVEMDVDYYIAKAIYKDSTGLETVLYYKYTIA